MTTTNKKIHWTQTPEGRARMADIARQSNRAQTMNRVKQTRFKEMAKDVVQSVKRNGVRAKRAGTVLIINGWRVTLERGVVRLDSE